MRTKTYKYIDTTDVSFHGVRRVEYLETLIQRTIDSRISIWISLCHLDLKDLPSHLFLQGIVTYNN